MNARHLIVRNVPPELAAALDEQCPRRGMSRNQTVLDLLSQALAVRRQRSNGLGRFAGTWSEEEFREFEDATQAFEEIDHDLRR